VKRHAQAAHAIGQETGDEHLLGRALYLLGTVDTTEGDLAAAARRLEESVRIGEARGLADIFAPGLTLLGAIANWQGDFRRALEISERAERAAHDTHDHFHEFLAVAFRCLAHVARGEYARALTIIEAGLVTARERNIAFNIGRLTNSLGWLHQELGDFRRAADARRAQTDAEEALQTMRAIGHPTLTWQAAHLLGRALAAQGRLAEAFDAVRLAVDTIDATAARAPDTALRHTFLAWPRVQAVQEDLERLRHA
jgi:tetratricopeptide (TPR) repeat protein